VCHHRRNHKQRRLNTDVAFVDTYSDAHHPVNALNDDASPGYCIPTTAFEIFRVHLPTQRFFDDLQTHSFGVAVEGLVARSCFLDGRIRQPETTGISNTDLTLFFRIARLVFQIGPKQQHLLGGVLAGFETRYPPHHSNGSNELRLPTTHKAFIAKLLNETNTNSLTSIIPLLPTVGLSGKHAYVSIPAFDII
jgi:hypothetical protein